MIHALSELGVILLMFSLGLEFSLREALPAWGRRRGWWRSSSASLMIWLGYVAGRLFGWTALESLFAGALIAISSTTIIVKAFAEQNVRGPLTDIVFGILIVEDLIAILLLAILTAISSGAALTLGGLAATAGRLAAFLAVVVGGGLLVVPRLMRAVVRLDRPETTVVAASGSASRSRSSRTRSATRWRWARSSPARWSAESGEAKVVEHLVQPVRDMFAAIFFVAVGMLIDPALVVEHWVAIVLLTVLVVVGKLVGVAVGVFLTGEGIRTAIQAGMSLAQIGEFSFIIAAVGQDTGATGSFLYPIAVTVSAVTTLLTPWLIGASDPVATYVDRRLPKPVQTFVALYGTWVEQLRTRPREPTVGRRMRQLARYLLLDAASLAAIVIGTAVWGGRVAAHLPVPDRFAWLGVVVGAAVLAVPFAIGIARCTVALARLLGASALPPAIARADMADAPRRALVVTLEIAILLLIGVPLVALTQPFLPPLPVPIAMAAVVVVLAFALWRSVANLQEHAQAGAHAILEVLGRQLGSQQAAAGGTDSDLEQLHRLLPGLGAPRAVRIRPGAAAVGKTLAELDLRGLTGATVLAIVREHGAVLTPTGREHLQAGDLLAVAGTTAAIAGAEALLATADAEGERDPNGTGRSV